MRRRVSFVLALLMSVVAWTSGALDLLKRHVPLGLDSAVRAQVASEPFLITPYYGTVGVNAWFDHDPNSGSMKDYRGQTNQVGYDQHRGIDFDVHYVPVLAAAAGQVTQARW